MEVWANVYRSQPDAFQRQNALSCIPPPPPFINNSSGLDAAQSLFTRPRLNLPLARGVEE